MIKSVKKYWLSDASFVSQMFVLAFLVFVLPILIGEGYYYPLLIQAIAQFMYFSLTSLTTVGFGDIFAENMAVKMLSVFLSAAGMLFPAIVLARLVSLVDKEPETLDEILDES